MQPYLDSSLRDLVMHQPFRSKKKKSQSMHPERIFKIHARDSLKHLSDGPKHLKIKKKIKKAFDQLMSLDLGRRFMQSFFPLNYDLNIWITSQYITNTRRTTDDRIFILINPNTCNHIEVTCVDQKTKQLQLERASFFLVLVHEMLHANLLNKGKYPS